MTTFIKYYLMWTVIVTVSMIIIFKVTEYLMDKPKTKFRQWWSRHIVDLDNTYND